MNWPTLVCPALLGGTPEQPVLLGNRCRGCGEPYFPAASGCTRCSGADLEGCAVGNSGTLWSWTVQLFEPKPPFDAQAGTGAFQPFGVGYVELPNGLKVESRLRRADGASFAIGQPMRLVLEPYRNSVEGGDIYTFAFEAQA